MPVFEPNVWNISRHKHFTTIQSAINDPCTVNGDVIVAVIDSGVDYNHPDLAANMWINPGEDHPPLGVVGPEDFDGINDDGNTDVNGLGGSPIAFRDSTGSPVYVRSERYVLLQTYVFKNPSSTKDVNNIEFYQMLHGHFEGIIVTFA